MSRSSKSATNSEKNKTGQTDLRERAVLKKAFSRKIFSKKSVTRGAEKSSLRIEGSKKTGEETMSDG